MLRLHYVWIVGFGESKKNGFKLMYFFFVFFFVWITIYEFKDLKGRNLKGFSDSDYLLDRSWKKRTDEMSLNLPNRTFRVE